MKISDLEVGDRFLYYDNICGNPPLQESQIVEFSPSREAVKITVKLGDGLEWRNVADFNARWSVRERLAPPEFSDRWTQPANPKTLSVEQAVAILAPRLPVVPIQFMSKLHIGDTAGRPLNATDDEVLAIIAILNAVNPLQP